MFHEVKSADWLATVLLICAMSGMSPSATLAQGGNHALLEEAVITATKRAESVQDVAVAINAYTSEQLDALGVGESGDIASFTPNFTWNTEFGRASPQPNIRGVGTNNFNANNTGPVAVYNDNVFTGPIGAEGFATFDIERVEVHGKNLGKKDYLTSGLDVSGFGWHATKPGNPRYIGAEIQYNFGGG